VSETPGPSIAPEVVTSAVWDAVKAIPGVADLHRNPLQALGERVRLDRHGPVRLESDDGGQFLEIHITARHDTDLSAVGTRVAEAGAACLTRTLGAPLTRVEVFVDDVTAADDD
jgi:uncharacterized alkaline shock family protein YloU